jgi:hypothetical protein
MAFRFDMKDKTPQQQAIVRARDARNSTGIPNEDATIAQRLNKQKADMNSLLIGADYCKKNYCVIQQKLCDGCESFERYVNINDQRHVECKY